MTSLVEEMVGCVTSPVEEMMVERCVMTLVEEMTAERSVMSLGIETQGCESLSL